MSEMPRRLQDEIHQELAKGETIRWMEQPIPRYFTSASKAWFVFGIPFTAFAVFWICGAAGYMFPFFSKGRSSLSPLFGVPFLLTGIVMLFAPLWARRKALKTAYVITDRRAITFHGDYTTTVASYTPDQLKNMYRKEEKDGTGDVILGKLIVPSSRFGDTTFELGFLRVRGPQKTEEMLRELIKQFAQKPSRTEVEEVAAHYIPQLGGPRHENAYHSLIEADDAIVPLLIDAYEHESDPDKRVLLFDVLCQHKAAESLEFLSRTISDKDPATWKLALDGLVSIGGPRAKEVLERERVRLRGLNPVPQERLDWVEEAIAQLGETRA
jgi:hypothetical protein